MSNDSFLKNLDDMISSIFSSVLKKDKVEEPKHEDVPQTIEEYTKVTGKRFRMTKNQKESGLPRQDAFQEFITTNWRK
tara:strand:+ start:408 stop:641 length:234 start_codon:yes stop_codon:yes gene_type:complete